MAVPVIRDGFFYGYPPLANHFNMLYLSAYTCKMRDSKSLLLVLLSLGLVSTWVYHIYDKTIYSQRKTEVYIRDSTAVADAVRDSLNRIYSGTIAELDTRLSYSRIDADSLRSNLDKKLVEINRLKSEINALLNKQGFSSSDLGPARQKINELQEKVDELNNQKLSMEEEKQQLTGMLEQLTVNVDTLQRNIRRLNNENKELNERIASASIFVASDLKIDAIAVKGNSEEPTSQAKKTDKFIVAFVVQNHVNHFNNAELTAVLIGPDGQVMQSTVWDSGSFETSEGQKNFTRKIRFDYEKGEQKNLLFSIDTEKCDKGTYTFQLWHNGRRIGQVSKTLS